MFRSNTVPYLVQSDCARGILRAILAEYNDESSEEYLQRLTIDAIAKIQRKLSSLGVMDTVQG